MLFSALKYIYDLWNDYVVICFKIFMVLWNDYVLICINICNFKGSNKYDRFLSLIFILRRFTENVIDFNFAKVYSNGPSFHL